MAQGDLEPPPHRGIQWTDRGSQPVREESEALWSWLHLVPPLSTARTPSCRWCHLAAAAAPIPDQDPRSLLKRVGPVKGESRGGPGGILTPSRRLVLIAVSRCACENARRRVL